MFIIKKMFPPHEKCLVWLFFTAIEGQNTGIIVKHLYYNAKAYLYNNDTSRILIGSRSSFTQGNS